ncbi:MAG: Coq4 family protein [Pseudomonadota bacterium]
MRNIETAPPSSQAFAFTSRPLTALAAGARFLSNIEDTAQFFRVTDAIDGRQYENNFQRYINSPVGSRLNAERVDFSVVLADTAYLEAQPANSLARAYLDFLNVEDLAMDMLMNAEREAEAANLNVDETRRIYIRNGIALHDILHIVTGYGRDPVGEACLLAFTAEQFRLKGVGLIGHGLVLREQARFPRRPILAMAAEARRNARAATWIPDIDWRDYFPRPVADARKALGAPAPEKYLEHFRGYTAHVATRDDDPAPQRQAA